MNRKDIEAELAQKLDAEALKSVLGIMDTMETVYACALTMAGFVLEPETWPVYAAWAESHGGGLKWDHTPGSEDWENTLRVAKALALLVRNSGMLESESPGVPSPSPAHPPETGS